MQRYSVALTALSIPSVEEICAFHEVGRLFPAETVVVSVLPGTRVVDALRTMVEKRYSQLPIMDGDRVRGVFSLWSLARAIATVPNVNIPELVVEDAMGSIPEVTADDSLHDVLRRLEAHEALLVRSPRGAQAIVTESDVLRYFYGVARPFVLVQEIELALRSVLACCAPGDCLAECIQCALGARYEKAGRANLPKSVEELSFEDYRTVISARDNWPRFQPVLGNNRDLVSARLARIRELRNAVFHFRTDLKVLDYQSLLGTRNWLLDKLRTAGVHGRAAEYS